MIGFPLSLVPATTHSSCGFRVGSALATPTAASKIVMSFLIPLLNSVNSAISLCHFTPIPTERQTENGGAAIRFRVA
jgi:hypothetical protein